MTFNALRPLASKFLEPMAKTTANAGVSPNAISMLSLIFAAFSGVMYYYSMSENPMVYVMLFILLIVFAYIAFTVLMKVLPLVMLIAFIGLIIGLHANSEDLSKLCLIVLLAALILFVAGDSYITFCESHPLGQAILNSGEKAIVVAGESAGNS